MQVKSYIHRLQAAYAGACLKTVIQVSCCLGRLFHMFCLFSFKAFFHMFICIYVSYMLNMLRLGFCFLALMPCHSFTCPCINAISVVVAKR